MTSSAEDTLIFGRSFGAQLYPGDMVLLCGSIGSGKSVLARGIGEARGVETWRGSPTFTLVNEYKGDLPLFHIDLYRLEASDLDNLGLEEYARPDSVVLVEWGDRAVEELEQLAYSSVWRIEIAQTGIDTRAITLQHAPAKHNDSRLDETVQ
ncbi:MAG: tRNA (adenosine(37)-N6)-threonylcarbamoyltransferase complex ATPase subunit type 1 TsaE [Chloroflexota bacterium]